MLTGNWEIYFLVVPLILKKIRPKYSTWNIFYSMHMKYETKEKRQGDNSSWLLKKESGWLKALCFFLCTLIDLIQKVSWVKGTVKQSYITKGKGFRTSGNNPERKEGGRAEMDWGEKGLEGLWSSNVSLLHNALSPYPNSLEPEMTGVNIFLEKTVKQLSVLCRLTWKKQRQLKQTKHPGRELRKNAHSSSSSPQALTEILSQGLRLSPAEEYEASSNFLNI